MRHYPETALQASIMDFWRKAGSRNCLLFSIPNERECSAQSLGRLKRMGLYPGIADLCLLFDSNEYKPPHFLECKANGNLLNEKQQQFRDLCRGMGWPYLVIRSLDQAIEVLREWNATRERKEPVNARRLS